LLVDRDQNVRLEREGRGYHAVELDEIPAGARYMFVLDGGKPLPDPASRHQPDGVHGASAVVASDFEWTDRNWRAPDPEDLVIYELHVGTFTHVGTFDGVAAELPRLRDLGINAIELMPISQFPGSRNWGYDGVFPFAAQSTYGGPAALKRLVNAAHEQGVAVILDVVYNHLGPEGNYLPLFGPYFTDRYRTPWGDALNFDGPDSDEVRAFFIQSALQWVDEFHIDGLRYDAIHAIVDASAYPFLAEHTDCVRARLDELGRRSILIAESDLSDPRVITPTAQYGLGFDAQWLDDFHHALHTLLTGERQGYYEDYGSIEQLRQVLLRAYAYAGHYSGHRSRRHGAALDAVDPARFIVCIQNHDQIGNRLAGDRLTASLSFDGLKLAAACTLLSPFVPMLYMGEEYGETRPFPYFVSHGDEDLVTAVRKGRKEEFASFGWKEEPPDPQSEGTFLSAVLNPGVASGGRHAALQTFYRDLIALRRAHSVIRAYDTISAEVDGTMLRVTRADASTELLLALNFGGESASIQRLTGSADGEWQVLFSTEDHRYSSSADAADAQAATSAFSAVLLERRPGGR
jgi:maltooligosyltrehalose trehalohydrolase